MPQTPPRDDSSTGCPHPTPHHRQAELATYLAKQPFALASAFRALAHFLGEEYAKDYYASQSEHEAALAQEIDELLDCAEPHVGGDKLRNLISSMATVVAELT